jgi:methanogenic corrinoid protein MtbC1
MNEKPVLDWLYHDFYKALNNYDKENCVNLVLKVLTSEAVDIPTLYEQVLAVSINSIASNKEQQKIGIWEEHVQSSIIRTIMEICYPYILQQNGLSGNNKLVAMVFCRLEEYHELGARMVTDFLTLLGFEACFIGANTPDEEVLLAAETLKPDVICTSITNYFHLSKINDLIDKIRKLEEKKQLKKAVIIAGGYAVENTANAKICLKADSFAGTYEELKKLKEEWSWD